jgi:hypothetical protein
VPSYSVFCLREGVLEPRAGDLGILGGDVQTMIGPVENKRVAPTCTARAGEGCAACFPSDGMSIRAFLFRFLPEGMCA